MEEGRTDLAGLAGPLRRTEALEPVLHVDAGPALSAGVRGAFVSVWNENSDTFGSFIGPRTQEIRQKVEHCSRPLTFSTGGPGPASWTVALKARWDLVAGPSVGTGVGHAGVFG